MAREAPSGTALITGASRGIGREFAHVLAANGHDLVLVARAHHELVELGLQVERESSVSVELIPADLTEPAEVERVIEMTAKRGILVEVLINNAGRGLYRSFVEGDPSDELEMIRLNILAPTRLAQHYARSMSERGRGWILNVASTAAFKSGPMMAVYNATKAYVLSLSEAIATELESKNVVVTALCPGATRTDFARAAGLQDSQLPRYKPIPTARTVAEYGYRSLCRGRPLAVHGWTNKAVVMIQRLLPRRTVAQLNHWIRRARA